MATTRAVIIKKRQSESKLQIACKNYFKYTYPQYVIAHVPNGGSRNIIEAANLKRQGVLSGFADLIILSDKGTFLFELKANSKCKQTENQREFEVKVKKLGYVYHVITSFDEFEKLIKQYL